MIFPNLKVKRIIGNGGSALPQDVFGGNLKMLGYMRSQGDPFSLAESTLNRYTFNSDFHIGGLINKVDETLTPLYSSNFTASVDGFVATSNCTLAFNQTVGGEGGWLKITAIGGVGNHYATKLITGLMYKSHKTSYKYYIESTNTYADSHNLIGHSGGFYLADPIAYQQANLDTINSVESNHYGANSDYIRVAALDGGNSSYDGASGDVIYIKDIIIESRSSPSFGQYINNAWPQLQIANWLFTTDGISDRLEDDVYFAQNNGSDLLGTFYFKVRDDEGTGNIAVMFASSSSVLNATDRFTIYLDGSDKLVILTKNGGVDETHVFPNSVTRGTTSIFIIKSTGAGFEGYQDDTDLGVPTNNNGNWMGDVGTLTYSALGRRNGATTAVYDAWGYIAFVYANRASTEIDDTQMKTWINAL